MSAPFPGLTSVSDPFAGLINTATAVGPSTAPGVPVLPQEGGSMSDMFGQVLRR